MGKECCWNRKKSDALLLLDFQNEFAKEGGKLHADVSEVMKRTGMLKKVPQVLEEARKQGVLIIHSPVIMNESEQFNEPDFDPKNYSKLYGLFTKGTWNAEFVEELKPVEMEDGNKEIVLTGRSDFNAFEGTNLEQILRENHVTQLCIAGFITNLCVEETARSAHDTFGNSMDVVVLTDGCAARSVKEHNNCTMITMPLFCNTMSCADYVADLSEEDNGCCCTVS